MGGHQGRFSGSEVSEETVCGVNLTAEFVRHVPWDKSGEDPGADGELLQAPQVPSTAAFAATRSVDPPRASSTRRRLHRVSSTPRGMMLRRLDIPRIVQVAGPCFKEAQGKLTRWSVEKGSGT